MRERRVAIVTGSSSGIGRALAERAVRAGWDVVAVGRRAERLAELARLVATATGRIETLALDLREPDAAQRIVRATLQRFGRIDVLVNCAGGTAVGRVTEQSDDALDEQMRTHVIVPLALAREALPSLRASSGLIIFFGSGVARIPVGTLGAYPPAKAAVRNMARVARNELVSDGVAVTYVDPGAVATEFMTRVGYAGPPAAIAASPYDVARTVFAAFTSRAPVVNAVPWQTFFVALGEALPRLTDALLARAPAITGGVPTLPPAPERLAQPISVIETASHEPSPSVADEMTASPEAYEPEETFAEPVEMVDSAPGPEPEPVEIDDSMPEPVTDVPPEATSAEPPADEPATYEDAIEPHQARMQRLSLKKNFVRSLLVPGTELDLGYVAMRWAGMPNKHERGLTAEVLESLADAGFLERLQRERYRVVRPPEPSQAD